MTSKDYVISRGYTSKEIDEYCEYLDEEYEYIKLFNRYEYAFSDVLLEVDPELFIQGITEYHGGGYEE